MNNRCPYCHAIIGDNWQETGWCPECKHPLQAPNTRKQEIESKITDIINSKQGMKATELAVEMFVYGEDWLDVIDDMVKEGKIVEVEYTLPTLSYRIKSFYLPAGTVVGINA